MIKGCQAVICGSKQKMFWQPYIKVWSKALPLWHKPFDRWGERGHVYFFKNNMYLKIGKISNLSLEKNKQIICLG